MKKIISLMFMLCLVVSLCTVSAYADGDIPHIIGTGDSHSNYIEGYFTNTAGDGLREGFTINIRRDPAYTGTEYATELAHNELKVELLDSSGNTITLTEWQKGYSVDASVGSCNVLYTGRSSSWGTTWYGTVQEAEKAAAVRFTIDGVSETFAISVIGNKVDTFPSLKAENTIRVERSDGLIHGYYSDITAAAAAAPAGSTITLLDNVQASGDLVFSNHVNLDFGNDYTINANGNKINISGTQLTVLNTGHIINVGGFVGNYEDVLMDDSIYPFEGNMDGYGAGFHIRVRPELPPALISKISGTESVPLTVGMQFEAGAYSDEQWDCYRTWFADFVLRVEGNKDPVVLFADASSNPVQPKEGANGYLAGEYGTWGWIPVPFDFGGLTPVTLNSGDEIEIMNYAANALNQPGLGYINYRQIVEEIKVFNCGIYLTPEFIEKNPDTKVILELRLYNPLKPDNSYKIGNTFVYPVTSPKPAAAPVANRYNVPSTADNSNVPLWTGLFLGFAAVAVLTMGKKRRS